MFASMGRDGQSLLHGDNGRWEGTLGSRAEESKFLSVWVQLPSASAKHTPAGAARRALGYGRRNHSRNRVKVQNHQTCCAANLCSSVEWPKHTCYLCESRSLTQDFTPVKPAGDIKEAGGRGSQGRLLFPRCFEPKPARAAVTRTCHN